MRSTAHCLLLLILCAPAFTQSAAQPAVKKSEQGICHDRGSATYKRTKHFEPYDRMDACLASGGRLAKNAPGEDGKTAESTGPSWLNGIGKKAAVIVGMLVIVGGAFLLSRRKGAGASQAVAQDDLERNRWEGNRRE